MAENTHMRTRLAIVLASLFVSAGAAFGDGGMFFRRAMPKYADVYQPTQKVYIRRDGMGIAAAGAGDAGYPGGGLLRRDGEENQLDDAGRGQQRIREAA